jgi:hypothetical protein
VAGEAYAADGGTVLTDAAHGPVLLNGAFPDWPGNPILSIIAEIYRVVPDLLHPGASQVVVDFVAAAQLVGNDWLVVFPPSARRQNRQYRLYLVGVLGTILMTFSGPVT